jgi:hypothetical protein
MYYHPQITGYIQKTKLPVKDALIALRLLIHSTLPDIDESFVNDRPVFHYNKKICYLQANRNFARIGFFNPGKLNDPNFLLKRSREKTKYIEFHSLQDIKDIRVTKWLREVATEELMPQIA